MERPEQTEKQQASSMPRILLIGSSGYAGVKSVGWFSEAVPNAAEYDIVVVNAVSLAEIIGLGPDEKSKPYRQVKQWQNWLSQLKDGLKKVLTTDGRVYGVIPDYDGSVGFKDEPPAQGWPTTISTTDWLPIPIEVSTVAGETLALQDETFSRYFANVRRWSYVFVDGGVDEDEDAPGWYTHMSPIAVNRAGQPLAVNVSYVLPRFRAGHLYLLPPPTEATLEEAVRIILEDFCGIAARTPEPEFVRAMRVPGEHEIDRQVEEKSQAITAIQQEAEALDAERARKRRFLALMYEKGIQGLQQVAQDAFDEMGLKTWDADRDVSDEFMVGDGKSEALIEVKGHRKSASKEDIRQLDESIDQYEKKFEKPVKGILLVNAWCETPVEEREKPQTQSFPDNVIKRAEAIGAAPVSGVELYNALCAVWEGRSTGKEVFSRLLAGNGVTKLT